MFRVDYDLEGSALSVLFFLIVEVEKIGRITLHFVCINVTATSAII